MIDDFRGMRAIWPALSLALGSALFLIALGIKMPGAREQVALVFSPSVAAPTTLQRIAALDGRVVRFGGMGNIVIARFDKDLTLGQMWRHGIWFGLDPVFAGGCFNTSTSIRNGHVS